MHFKRQHASFSVSPVHCLTLPACSWSSRCSTRIHCMWCVRMTKANSLCPGEEDKCGCWETSSKVSGQRTGSTATLSMVAETMGSIFRVENRSQNNLFDNSLTLETWEHREGEPVTSELKRGLHSHSNCAPFPNFSSFLNVCFGVSFHKRRVCWGGSRRYSTECGRQENVVHIQWSALM